MAKINRPNVNVKAFASEALAGERTVFNGVSQSDDIADNINSSYRRGFGVIAPNEYPKLEDFNAVHYTQTQNLAYLFQAGVAEWALQQEYHRNDIVAVDGRLYKSTVDNNIGNNPAVGNTADWSEFTTLHTDTFTIETSTELKSMGNGLEAIKVNTDNSISLLTLAVFDDEGDGVGYAIFEEINDTINMFQGGKMVVQPITQDRFLVLTQNEMGIYDINRNTLAINQVGNKLITEYTTASNYDVTVVTGEALDSALNHIIVYNGDTENLDYYTFDGTDIVFVSTISTALSGVVQLARPEFFTQYFAAYEESTGTIHSFFFNGTSLLADGVTSVASLPAFTKIDDGVDSTIVAINETDNLAYILNNSTSNITQIGDVLDMSSYDGTIVTPFSTNALFTASPANDTISFVSAENQQISGFQYWVGLSAQTIGFDNDGINVNANNVQDAIRQIAEDICWPRGSVLRNRLNGQNPAQYLGFGIWNRIEGVALFAISDSDPSFAFNATGGSKTHSHGVEGQSMSATDTVLIPRDGWGSLQSGSGQLPEPSIPGRLVTGSGSSEINEDLESLAHAENDRSVVTQGHTHDVSGTTDEQNNLPPYMTVYTWYRVS